MPPLLRRLPTLALFGLLCGLATAQTQFVDRHVMLPAFDGATESLALVDLDGDGDLDLVFGNGLAQNRMYENDGSGVFSDRTEGLPVDAGATCAVVAADFNGDTQPDLFIGNGFGSDANALYLANAAFDYTDVTATHLPADNDGTEDAAAVDVDGDGDLDLLIGNDAETGGGQQNRLYLNDGTGVFSDVTAAQMPIDLELTEALAAGDVDGDGDLDVAYANDGAQNRLYRNDGAGLFADATASLPAGLFESEAVGLRDVDGDGDLDLIYGNSGTSDRQNRVYTNDGTGVFSDETALLMPVDQDDTEGLDLGDVDGDGDLDLYLSNFLDADRLYLNDGTGVFADAGQAALPPSFPRSTDLRLGDLDGDLDLDVALAFFRYENRLFLNDGAGLFTAPSEHVPLGFLATVAAALLDADGDGDLDALLGLPLEDDVLLKNEGNGAFVDASDRLPALAVPTETLSLLPGDLDGDGDTDVYVGALGPDGLLLANGAGGFDAGALFLGFGPTTDAVFADVDLDGDLDVLAASLGPNHLLLGDGLGGFLDASASLPPAVNTSSALAAGDVDADGDLDFVFGNGWLAPEANTLLLGEPAIIGGFGTLPLGTLPANLEATAAVELGDVDGDGDLDLVTGNSGPLGAANRLYLGDGTGSFAEAVGALPADLDATEALSLTDLDADGDLDLYIGNGRLVGAADKLLRNDGAGLFTLDAAALPARAQLTVGVEVGDLDGDAEVDLFVATEFGQSRVLLAAGSQLAWRGEPRIGKPLSFALDGPAGEPWFLAYSIQTIAVPLPPLGTLYLDPATTGFVGTGFLDGDGQGAISIPIADNPAAVGLDLPWQAVIGQELRLSNLERVRLTAL